jgi:hypothetical protein
MQRITLSDHTADMVQQAEQQRAAENAARVAAYEKACQQKLVSVDAARQQMRDAWSRRKVFAAISHALRMQWRNQFGWPSRPRPVTARTDAENVWKAGSEGEAGVAQFLARQLNDEWTLVCGYSNARGEIDQVLVGPRGVFAIEVKNVNLRVRIAGDTWTGDKYDNYGNLKETGKVIADKRGRSPARQINESADRMVEFLRKSMPQITCHRLVVLSHPKAVIESASDPTAIPIILSQWNLDRTIFKVPVSMDVAERSKVIEVLKRDHAYHQKRRDQPKRSVDPAAA